MVEVRQKTELSSSHIEQTTGAATSLALSDTIEPSVDLAVFGPRKFPISITTLQTMILITDIILLSVIAYLCLQFSEGSFIESTVGAALPFMLIPIFAIGACSSAGAYRFGFNRSAIDHILKIGNAAGFALLGLGAATLLISTTSAGAWAIAAMMTAWLTLMAMHAHYVTAIKMMMRAGSLSENVVIVGATPNAQRLIERNQKLKEVHIVGVFDDRLERAPRSLSGTPLLGRLEDLFLWNRLPEIDKIIVTITPDAKHRVREMVDRLRILPQHVVIMLDFDGFNPEKESLARIANSSAAYVSGQPKDARRAVVKRLSDIILASAMLVVFSPVIFATAIAVKLTSPGPIIFKQRRHGFNNQIIRVWKFRSMRDDKVAAEKMSAQTKKNDPRVTGIGRIIRKTSIDELPQLFNVLLGEMSIVGPRPHAVGMTTEETEVHAIVGDYAHRHRVKPGITGWAQINGSRGPVHTKEEVRDRVEYDMEYVNRSSLWFDLYIMMMTAPCLLGDAKRDR